MRSKIVVLTVVSCAATAVMAATPAQPLFGDRALAAAGATNPTGHIDANGSFRGNMILIKGDKTGTGPGAGGHKGKKEGKGNSEGKGKQKGKNKS
ncbi:MAG: hypothetical protein E6G91_21365 [Alphaproteobacteria bacterium]|nr:MAG: hypothetical protein E6G91_21365 [Alphaproteobacteria bacterium]